MNALSILKQSSLFHGWSEGDLQKLAAQCKIKDLGAGEGLFVQGEESQSFFIVGSGTVVIRRMSAGEEEAVSTVGPGSVLGEMAMLVPTGSPVEARSAGAEAREHTVVVEIPLTHFEKMVKDSPALGMMFYKNLGITLAGRIRRTTEDLAGLRSLRLRHV